MDKADYEPQLGPQGERARQLVDYLTNSLDYPYAKVISASSGGLFDDVELLVEPELPQRRKVPIESVEPIRIVFVVDDTISPSIFATRDDFPLDLVHTNFDRSGIGRCLCIWEENWADLKRALTAHALVERIRNWFSRAATGALHQDGQMLEPMIPAVAPTLVIPAGQPPSTWYVVGVDENDRRTTLQLGSNPAPAVSAPISIFSLTTLPQVQGAMHHRPTTLEGLVNILGTLGVDVMSKLKTWLTQPEQLTGPDRGVIILITIPMRASADAEVSAWDHWAMNTRDKLYALGEKLGLTSPDPDNGRPRQMLVQGPIEDLGQIGLGGWRVVQRLDRAAARAYSGIKNEKDAKLVGIGAGAIGSHVISNAVHSGTGRWTVIDDDISLPHNVVRQVQGDHLVGLPKAEALVSILEGHLAEGGHQAISANFLEPGRREEDIKAALAEADIVFDFSASPSVLGALAEDETIARAASCFFNPSGHDLVILAEDSDRTIRIDELEAQYFLATARDPRLSDHLTDARVGFVRYANACQDLTRPLPPWQVHTLAGIAGGNVPALLENPVGGVAVWQLNPKSGEVRIARITLSTVRRLNMEGCRVTVSDSALRQMRALRHHAAPNETGGVLLGSYDLYRRILHIVHAQVAPPDSHQAPTYFIRGAADLQPLVDELGRHSAGVIGYVGEWHSHPDTAEARPSNDDEDVWKHLQGHLAPTGQPYAMLICGKEQTWIRVGWQGSSDGEGVMPHVAS